MEVMNYIVWGIICFIVSVGLLVFVGVLRGTGGPRFLGYVAIALLAYTSLTAFEGFFVAWSGARKSKRHAAHLFTRDELPEQVFELRYHFVAFTMLVAVALLHFGPRGRGQSVPPPLPKK
jgi:hypothetical protein